MAKTLFFVILLILTRSLECSSSLVLVQSLDGVVPRENFVYLTLNYGGNVILELITKEGDADLYVSERFAKPGYELDRYDLHSATCGKDTVYIPKSFVRPLGIGVYGYGAHDFSHYTLDVYVVTQPDDDDLELAACFEDVDRRHESSRGLPVVVEDTAPATTTTESKQVAPPPERRKKLKKLNTRSGLWALLEMFEMIFLSCIMTYFKIIKYI